MRVLPSPPTAGESALRIHLGDSLLASDDEESLFGHADGSTRLVPPRDHEILIPEKFVRQDGFADKMRRIVEAAIEGLPVPLAVVNSVDESLRDHLERCRDALAKTIGEEGNSVWTWYATNIAAPHLLSQRKVDRIVANPPWVALSAIQEAGRKRSMEDLGARLGLQAGGNQSANLDIAAFFVLRARELYLHDPQKDRAVWLVKKSALDAGHWERFRGRHEGTLSQSVDLEALQPFGGGDARRCCLLIEHAAFVFADESAISGASQSTTPTEARFAAHMREQDGAQAGRQVRPKAEESWSAVRPQVRFAQALTPLPQEGSGYGLDAFRRGATVFPHVLLFVERAMPQASGRALVRTKRSMHRPWSAIPPQDVEIPNRWVRNLYRSPDMLPFVASLRGTKAIIPVAADGTVELDSAQAEAAWAHLDETYRVHKGKGKHTPACLGDRIDYGAGLSAQALSEVEGLRMVLYPNAGDIMRAARTGPGSGFVDSTLYWFVAASEQEAGYLTALMNAPSLRRAFFESRRSGRHFELHPWRRVPIQRYDKGDYRHRRLAELCRRAEEVALEAARNVAGSAPTASQVRISSVVRTGLVEAGVSGEIDKIARELLPSQASPDG